MEGFLCSSLTVKSAMKQRCAAVHHVCVLCGCVRGPVAVFHPVARRAIPVPSGLSVLPGHEPLLTWQSFIIRLKSPFSLATFPRWGLRVHRAALAAARPQAETPSTFLLWRAGTAAHHRSPASQVTWRACPLPARGWWQAGDVLLMSSAGGLPHAPASKGEFRRRWSDAQFGRESERHAGCWSHRD